MYMTFFVTIVKKKSFLGGRRFKNILNLMSKILREKRLNSSFHHGYKINFYLYHLSYTFSSSTDFNTYLSNCCIIRAIIINYKTRIWVYTNWADELRTAISLVFFFQNFRKAGSYNLCPLLVVQSWTKKMYTSDFLIISFNTNLP